MHVLPHTRAARSKQPAERRIRIFFNLSLFYQNFTFIPDVKTPSLDPELGVVTYGAKVTRLGAIGHGTEVGGPE